MNRLHIEITYIYPTRFPPVSPPAFLWQTRHTWNCRQPFTRTLYPYSPYTFSAMRLELVSDDHEMLSACINRPIQVPVDTVLHVYFCVRDLATLPPPPPPPPPPPHSPYKHFKCAKQLKIMKCLYAYLSMYVMTQYCVRRLCVCIYCMRVWCTRTTTPPLPHTLLTVVNCWWSRNVCIYKLYISLST